MKLAPFFAVLLLTACASGVPDLDVAQVDTTCGRWCADAHPSCAFVGAIVEPKTEALRACHNKYMECVRTCPPK